MSGEYSFTICVCECVCFPEVSEMVMPLTPMQGRLNSSYWLCEHLPSRIQTIQFYFNWGLQTEREEVPRLHVAQAQIHTHVHNLCTHSDCTPHVLFSSDIDSIGFNPSLPCRDKCSQHNKGCVSVVLHAFVCCLDGFLIFVDLWTITTPGKSDALSIFTNQKSY